MSHKFRTAKGWYIPYRLNAGTVRGVQRSAEGRKPMRRAPDGREH